MKRALGIALLAVMSLASSWGLGVADLDHRATARNAPESPARVAAAKYSAEVLGQNQIGITVSNYGFIGNNFNSRLPSYEYPLGTGFEHIVRGGLWIGGHARDLTTNEPFIGVSTGTVDGSTNDVAQQATEFTPAASLVSHRSTLHKDSTFSVSAVSYHDDITYFDDKTPVRSGNNPERHHPMNLSIRQENYSWPFGDLQHFVIFHWVIRNDGLPLDSMWVGVYGEMASGPKNSYSCWPPSSTCSSIGTWFGRKWIAYDDSIRAFREHYCYQGPIPGACVADRVKPWAGFKLLTPPDPSKGQKVTLAVWNYDPSDTAGIRNTDAKRYGIMSAGTIQPLPETEWEPGGIDASGNRIDPVELLAIGPFGDFDHPINPGDSVVVDFAFVGGDDIPAFVKHARAAQRAFDLQYKVPVPPPSPQLELVAHEKALDLVWDREPEFTKDPTSAAPDSEDFEGYRIYLGTDPLALHLIKQFDKKDPPHDTTGFNTGLPPLEAFGSDTLYRFTVSDLRDGFKYYAAVTSYDLGTPEDESLESGIEENKALAIPGPAPGEAPGGGKITVFPNPYRVEARWDQASLVRDHYLWFTNLPERCTIQIYTLSGDRVFATHFDGDTYHGEGARGIFDPKKLDVAPPTLSGRTFGWNMITDGGQAAATGLYLYSIEQDGSSKRTVGKFLIVKSDRENF
jgi:hypothetical protein